MFLLAHVVHPDSGGCADWVICNAPRRHTTGNKNFIMAYTYSVNCDLDENECFA